MAVTTRPTPGGGGQKVNPSPRRPAPWVVQFYRSAVGKKWVMALTGMMIMGFVIVHALGNLKMYIGPESINSYGEALRDLGGHLVPRTHLLWIMRFGLIAAFALHIHSAYSLTRMNRRARPQNYESPRDYIAVDFAARTMRYTGVIIALYILFHLADLTWGTANPDFVRGDVYANLVHSFERVPVAIIYILANLALGLHLFHGASSMFQSIGVNNERVRVLRPYIAGAIALSVTAINVSYPLAVQFGIVSLG